MTDRENERLAGLAKDVEYIREKVDCLPNLCSDVARQDERIKSLQGSRKWLVGWLTSLSLLAIGAIFKMLGGN